MIIHDQDIFQIDFNNFLYTGERVILVRSYTLSINRSLKFSTSFVLVQILR